MQFRKKPVVIEAIQYDGTHQSHREIVSAFGANISADKDGAGRPLSITTLEGVMTARVGDWIIKGVNGEVYPCKPDIFEKTYEQVETESR